MSKPQNELECIKLAAISTASFGYWKEGDSIKDEYDSVALRDVAKLYAKYDDLFKQVARYKEKFGDLPE